jgi:putative membrane protein
MRIVTLIFVLIVLVIGISFAVINANMVPFHYYFGKASVPLSLLLVFTLVVGAILGLAAGIGMYFKAKRGLHGVRKQLHNTQKELANLRKLPLKEK